MKRRDVFSLLETVIETGFCRFWGNIRKMVFTPKSTEARFYDNFLFNVHRDGMAILLILISMLVSLKIQGQNTNTYLGPEHPLPGNPDLIRVQVLIYNDPNPKGGRILRVSFDGVFIPLKERDIYGYRGQASFQKKAGKYKLRWEVEREQKSWPRTVQHEQQVDLDARDLWLQISIIGEEVEIS